mgnify:CR=1 FL=1
MFKNYFKIALRNMKKTPGYSAMNIAGLALGMACCLLILLFVQDELRFDDFHQKGDRIYRINKTVLRESGDINHTAEMPGHFGPTLVSDFPEVESAVRIRPWWSPVLVTHGEKSLKLENFVITDSTFFTVFDFELIEGDPERALNEPLSAVITEEVAQQFFGAENPIGKVLEGLFDMPLKITGVARKPPENSHLQFNMLISWSTSTNSQYANNLDWMNRWITQAIFTYVVLAPNAGPAALEAKFPDFMQKYMTRWADIYHPYLQPFSDIHLGSTQIPATFQMNHRAGNITFVYTFSIIAFLVLLIACVNFTNMATARAARRAKEVGMRKVLGAFRKQLIWQFIGESILISSFALLTALILIWLALPAFNDFAGRSLTLNIFENTTLLTGLISVTLFVGLAAGIYPAFVLAAYRPAAILRKSGGKSGALLRKILVVFQFVVSIVLIVATSVVYKQTQFMQNRDLGFNKERMLKVEVPNSPIRRQMAAFKQNITQHSSVISASSGSGGPSSGTAGFDMLPEGRPPSERRAVPTIGVDFDYLDTFEMKIVSGRNFNTALGTDSSATIINETLARQLGWENPLGKMIALGTDHPTNLQIIGVVKDFHVRSLHEKVRPVLIYITGRRFNELFIRIAPANMPETIGFLRESWQKFEQKHPFEYTFVDEDFNRYYQSEQKLMQLLSVFAALAIAIACLGLFSLAAFTAEQRRKEIGVRKVLGATVPSILNLLSRDFLRLVIIAGLASSPLAWFLMREWLQDFPYRTDIGLTTLGLAGIAALFIAFVTVSFQALRAAGTNPVTTLREE